MSTCSPLLHITSTKQCVDGLLCNVHVYLSLFIARLHTEQEKGFFTGKIEAMDIENHRYWVAFDRPGLGKHAILDTEIRVSNARNCLSH